MNRRWRTAVILLSAAFVFSLVWGSYQLRARRQAEAILSARYQQSFFDALGHIENVEVLLSKALVSTTPRENIRYMTELWQQAFSAQANLNALPLGHETLMRTSRFLTQLGDYGFIMSQKMADGSPLSDEDWEQLRRLQAEISSLGLEINQIALESAGGSMPWEEIQRRSRVQLNPFARGPSRPEQPTGFARIEQQMQEAPTLVYDGPFSDHMLHRKPLGLSGDPVDSLTARGISLQFAPLPDTERPNFLAEQVGETGNEAPLQAWHIQIRHAVDQAARFTMDVAKDGGHVLWMLNSRSVGASKSISLDQAVTIARNFLEERGFENFDVTYPVVEDGRAIIPFAKVENGIVLYPDQVKVTVALDEGDVVGFDALQYYMAHHERNLSQPQITPEEAREAVAPTLDVEHVRLALIPKADGKEILTYEVKARDGDRLYHIYINALNGSEEQILRIIESAEAGLLAL